MVAFSAFAQEGSLLAEESRKKKSTYIEKITKKMAIFNNNIFNRI